MPRRWLLNSDILEKLSLLLAQRQNSKYHITSQATRTLQAAPVLEALAAWRDREFPRIISF